MSNLMKRVSVAALFIPLFLFILIKGGIYLSSLFLVIANLSFLEYINIFFKDKDIKFKSFYFFLFFSYTIFFFIFNMNSTLLIISIYLFLILGFGIFLLENKKNLKGFTDYIAKFLLGYVYLMLPLYLLIKGDVIARAIGFGYHFILFYTLIIWINDTMAYFSGRLLGKHHFSFISPKKTIEGVIGGVLFSIIFSIIYHYYFNFLSLKHVIIISFLVSIIAVSGDLFESALKRDKGIKDSSNIIPGHGGILDRFDAFIYTAAIYYLYFYLFLFS